MSSSRHLRSPPKKRSSLRDSAAMDEIEMQATNSSVKAEIMEPPSMRTGMRGRDPIEDYVPFSPISGVAPAPGFSSARPIVVASTPIASGPERIQQSGGSKSSKTPTSRSKTTSRQSSVRSPRKASSPVSRAPRSGSRSPRKMAAEIGVAVAKEQLRKRQLQEQLALQKQQHMELALLQQKQEEELKRQQLVVKAQAEVLETAIIEKPKHNVAKQNKATSKKANHAKSKQNFAKQKDEVATKMSSIRRTLQREAKLAKRPMADELLERIGDDDSTDDERYHPRQRHSRGASFNEQRSQYSYTDTDGSDYLGTTDSCYDSFTEVEVVSTMDSSHTDDDMHYDAMVDDVPGSPVDKYKHRLQKWYRNRLPTLSKSASHSTMDSSTIRGASTTETDDFDDLTADPREKGSAFAFIGDDPILSQDRKDIGPQIKKQGVAYCTVGLTSIQLLILMLQLAMCGIAPLDMNPMIGPFPDAFSLWGGKNPYKMLQEDQWWRILSPCLLHMGILHWVVNAFCHLTAVAIFEREWGWFKWTLFYLISTVGCSAFSNYFDQDSVAVGSSGSLMGLYAAKLAQVVTLSLFESHSGVEIDDIIQLDQLSSVLCGLTLLSVMGSFTYIDWSGNMGGLLSGFLAGVFVFSSSIEGCCWSFLWFLLGFTGTVASIGYAIYLCVEEADPDEELADVCNYFRSLWPENYECGCMWE